MPSPDDTRIESSSAEPRWRTAVLTGIVTVVLATLLLIPVTIRNADDETERMRLLTIWQTFLDNLPRQMSGVFSPFVMGVLLVLALAGISYIVVTAARIGSREIEDNTD